MPDIFHDFIIVAKKASVFAAISTPRGLDEWWTKTSSGEPHVGAEYELGFGEGVDWRARVTQVVPNQTFELQITSADPDWQDSRIRFELRRRSDSREERRRPCVTGHPVSAT